METQHANYLLGYVGDIEEVIELPHTSYLEAKTFIDEWLKIIRRSKNPPFILLSTLEDFKKNAKVQRIDNVIKRNIEGNKPCEQILESIFAIELTDIAGERVEHWFFDQLHSSEDIKEKIILTSPDFYRNTDNSK